MFLLSVEYDMVITGFSTSRITFEPPLKCERHHHRSGEQDDATVHLSIFNRSSCLV